jgi:hypothetical protein
VLITFSTKSTITSVVKTLVNMVKFSSALEPVLELLSRSSNFI